VIGTALSRPNRRGRKRYDVVFYTPFVGWMLTSASPSPPGGAETQILLLARALARLGLRVGIIAYGNPAELPAEVDGVTILARPPYKLAHKRLIGKALEAWRIWQSLWRAPSHTVVYRCASLELGLVGLFTKYTGRRLVFSSANVVDFSFAQLARNRRDVILYHLGVRLADEIVVQTDEQVRMCEAAFGRRAMLVPSMSPVAEAQHREPEAFLWVGRLVWYKQPLAYLQLAEALPECKFWLVGVPSNDARDHELAREVGLAAHALPNLELLQPRPRAGVGELMDRAVASVNTAIFEGMPNTLLEAWSRGVPALVLNHDPGGVVKQHKLGGYADGAPETFAQLARALWDERHDRRELARRCVKYIVDHHAPEVVAEQWLEALQLSPPRERTNSRPVEATCVG
jgi:glycosyltransferase involved in cell wall biosynthesis